MIKKGAKYEYLILCVKGSWLLFGFLPVPPSFLKHLKLAFFKIEKRERLLSSLSYNIIIYLQRNYLDLQGVKNTVFL